MKEQTTNLNNWGGKLTLNYKREKETGSMNGMFVNQK